jgi:exodeoxyribonuclease VII large subunit
MANAFGLPFDDPEPASPATKPAARSAASAQPPPSAQPHASTPRHQTARPTQTLAPQRQVVSVTQLTMAIRDQLESEFQSVWVEGELSNSKVWTTGHLYFTLKDDRSQLRGFMSRVSMRYLKFKPVDGLQVIARGRISVYEPKGDYQLTCEHLEPKGLGALQLAFEQLKKRLQAEGLFDEARKRALPALPRTIGIVTSLDGAAVRDMLKVLGRRHTNTHIIIRPSRVQGEGAALEIARAIDAVSRVPGVDVVIVGRGGGSIEDLWAFNEEAVARAIARCPVPVIAAVGHETDVTIADFVADRRAPTPSAAAEIVVAATEEFASRIDRLRGRLEAAARGRIQTLSRRVHMLSGRPALAGIPTRVAMRGRDVTELAHRLARQVRARFSSRERVLTQLRRQLEGFDLGRRLGGIRTRLATSDAGLRAAIVRQQHQRQARLGERAGRLDALSPLAVLGRGYAVAWNADRTRALRDEAEVRDGERIRITLSRGEIDADVRKPGDRHE